MLLLGRTFFCIRFQVRCNKGLDFWREHTWCAEVFLPFPRDIFSLAVFLDGIPGYAHGPGDAALAFTIQPSTSYFFVVVHCDYHLHPPP